MSKTPTPDDRRRFRGATAKVDAGKRHRCLDAGADDLVAKPTEAAQLFAIVRPFLDGSRRQEP